MISTNILFRRKAVSRKKLIHKPGSTLFIDNELHRLVRIACASRDIPVHVGVSEAIRMWLKKQAISVAVASGPGGQDANSNGD